MHVLSNVPLSALCTLRVGGPARWIASVGGVDRLRLVLRRAERRRLPVLLLGRGSNVVLPEGGWPGVVVTLRNRSISFRPLDRGKGERFVAEAGAGASWDRLVAASVRTARKSQIRSFRWTAWTGKRWRE